MTISYFVAALLLTTLLVVCSTASGRADPARPLRVVTYNLLHDGATSGFLDGRTHLDERLEIAMRELKAIEPDIVAVQEASESRTHGNVAERLAKALGFHVVFEPATEQSFSLWPLDKAAHGLQRRLGDPEPLSDHGVRRPELPGCQRRLEPRIMLEASLFTPGDRFRCFRLPLAVTTSASWKRVGEIVRDRLGAGPSLLLGDFNATETSKVLTKLTVEAGFIDAFRIANPQSNGPTVWQRIESPESTVSRRVDFILFLNGRASNTSVHSSRILLDHPGAVARWQHALAVRSLRRTGRTRNRSSSRL
jgi:endonuclease/exonuclease/phosphatase family metal-dependent hydrolase